ncbi:hypothetical protein KVR01_007169 [Diaporthe batatas]|uniref:uncharacterized protein n=1 Tax=Diaporthe batatas TaxID=748121 RepID=UPI001D046817|nr:uncharacterized protein KVR01_007169 [Diaporthe batatas]KAG8162691.1 hypothetical protein KVR01_007169 [Diaporthe batatas]
MSLERLPTEVLHTICQDVGLLGSSELVNLARASRRLHAISNPVLYATDLQESGGVKSMCFGLVSRQNGVIKLCLAAGIKPDLRVESRHDLGSMFNSKVQKRDALGFSLWSRDHLGIGRNGQRSPGPASCPSAERYDDPNQDMNKPFLSFTAFFWTPLHVAALLNDVELLALLLDHGANPNSAGRGVCPCYYQGLRHTFGRSLPPVDRDPIFEMLERRVVTRWSALHVAVCEGNLDCAEYLISRFGLPHAIESDDAVMAEADQFFRAEPVLSGLVNYDPDAINHVALRFDPSPPLHTAVNKPTSLGDLEKLYAMLQRAGCLDVDALDAFGDTPLAVAAFAGQSDTAGIWLRDRGADVNFALLGSDGVRYSILNALCKSGQHRDATLLMDLGVDVNRDSELRRGLRYESPLHLCCGWLFSGGEWPVEEISRKQREAVTLLKRLVHAGAEMDARDEDGMTPLMSAAALHFSAAVGGLLEGKPDIGAEDDDGDSALHHAVANGVDCSPGEELNSALATIQLLLDHGADPNQLRADMNERPLFQGSYSITEGTPGDNPRTYKSDRFRGGKISPMASIAALLISRGADPNIYLDHPRDDADTLAEQVFDVQGHSLAVTAFYEGEFDTLDSLVACGTLVTCQDYLLMMRSLFDPQIRSKGSKSSAVQALFRILNGPSMRLEPQEKKSIMDAWTELLILSVGQRPGLVRVLAPHFSITSKLAPGGKTALHVLAQWERKSGERPARFQHRVDRTMAALMRCGAARQINQPDDNGRTPLHVAGGWRNLAVARALIRAGASLHLETKRQDGITVDSPLRTAIKGYSEASWFKMANGMLDAYHSKWGRKEGGLCGSAGLMKDLILHFRDHPFDDQARMAGRTKTLMVKLFDLGVDVNEPDEDGNTPLHLLVQLLYPLAKDAEGIETSEMSKRARDNSVDPPGPDGYDPEGVFCMPNESYMHMRGVNSGYPSDSDFEEASSEEDQQTTDDEASNDDDEHSSQHGSPLAANEHGPSEDDDRSDDDQGSDDDGQQDNADDDGSLYGDFFEGNSLRVMARKDYDGERPQYRPSGLAKRGRGRKLDRADAWILSFYILLCESKCDGLKVKNNAGKTPLDLIHGLKGLPVPRSFEFRRVIKALAKLDAEDPLGSAVLNRLNGASALPKKDNPFFFVYNRSGCYLVVPRQGGKRGGKRRGPAWDKWTWVPFW